MKKWQLHEAKNKLSNLIDTAMNGNPQCITKRGEDAVILMSIAQYHKLKQHRPSLKDFLTQGVKFDDLEITRSTGAVREI
jgi:prevent-host-death family protein